MKKDKMLLKLGQIGNLKRVLNPQAIFHRHISFLEDAKWPKLIQCVLELPSHLCHSLYHQILQNQFTESSFLSHMLYINLHKRVSFHFAFEIVFSVIGNSKVAKFSDPLFYVPQYFFFCIIQFMLPLFSDLMKTYTTLVFCISLYSLILDLYKRKNQRDTEGSRGKRQSTHLL